MKTNFKVFFAIIIINIVTYASYAESRIDNYLSIIDVVYHGSTHRNIDILKPHSQNIRDSKEGDLLFASPSIALASCYLFKWDDSWVHQYSGFTYCLRVSFPRSPSYI